MSDAPVRIALVGTGTMGSLHARVIAQSERAELAYVVDPDADAAAAIAGRFGSEWRTELDIDRATRSGIDAVIVAAPTEAHHQIGAGILAAGLPLLMEKPLAGELSQVEDLIVAAERSDVPLMCGLLERFNPALMTALAIAERPRHVIGMRHSPYVARIKTGVCADLLIHDVDIVARLADADPIQVRAAFGHAHPDSLPGAEDIADAVLTFPDGMIANLSASRISQRKMRTFAIAEIDRLIEIDMVRNTVTIYRHVLNEADPDRLGYRQQTIIEIPALVSSREPLVAQLDRFLDLIAGTADIKEERASILPAHRAIAQVRAAAGR